MKGKVHEGQRVNSRSDVIYYDAETLREFLKLPDGRGFYDIEPSKKYKAEEERFPRDRIPNERDELTCNLVDDNKLGVFDAGSAGDPGRGGDPDENHETGEDQR